MRGVFVGPWEVAGVPARLANALIKMGIRTIYVDYSRNPLGYTEGPQASWLTRLAAAIAERRTRSATVSGWFLLLGQVATSGVLLAWAIVRCDVFVFTFGRTLFGLRELPLLRLLGKRIVFMFFGSDVRPPYLDGSYVGMGESAVQADLARKLRMIRVVERYSDAVICHDGCAQLLNRPYVSALALGVPGPEQGEASRGEQRRAGVRVLHAPSHPRIKGTTVIRQAIQELEASGMDIDYREATGVSNREVREEIARSDFVVDQMYSDIPLSSFGAEAASQGKAVVVGSLDWDAVLSDLPPVAIPPIVRCAPESVREAIAELVVEPETRLRLGRRAIEFMSTNWDGASVAGRFLQLFSGDAPDSWFRDPSSITYVGGCGLSRGDLQRELALVLEHGRSGLGLSGNPKLEERLVSRSLADDLHSSGHT